MVCHQKIIWMVRWRIQLLVLAKVGEKLEVMEERETSRKGEGKADCSP